MQKENVFIPLYRSFAFRYLLSIGIIEKLSKEYKLVFFINLNNKKFFEKYLSHYNPIFEDINKYDKKVYFFRLKIFVNILKKFYNGKSNNLKNNSHKVWKVKYKQEIKSKKFFFLIFPLAYFLNNSKLLRKIFLKLEEIFDNTKNFDEYFKKYNPKLLLITSYGYDFDQYFTKSAKKNNCKTISIIYSWDNPTSKGYKSSDSDFYIVWNNNMKQELITFQDIKEKKIIICGTAHWDSFHNNINNKEKIRNAFLNENGLSKKRKIILFFSSSPRDFNNAYEKIDYICNELRDDSDFLVIARMHPLYMDKELCKKYLNNDNTFYENKLIKKYQDNLIFFNPQIIKFGSNTNEVFYPLEDLQILSKLYCSAGVLLNEYSTTLLEGMIFDLPVINVSIGNYRNTNLSIKFYNQHHHLWRLQKYNAIIECDNYKDIKKNIDDIFSGNDITKSNRKLLINNEININRGCAGNQIIKEIKKILNN